MEAEPLAKITQQNVKNFVWKNIVCRFGVPRVLVFDNGRQFDNTPFREFWEQLRIRNHYSSPSHPQANGQAEVANRSLLKIIKTQLEGAKGVWPDELRGVLWAYRTTMRTLTGETPFKLAYGSKAVIPAEVHMTSHRGGSIKLKKTKNSSVLTLTLWTKSGWMQIREQRGTKILWQDNMMPWWSLGASTSGISSWRGLPWQQETRPMGNLGQIGKDLIGLSTARGKDPTIWKFWMDEG